MMKAAFLAEPLVFTGGYRTRQSQAVAVLTEPMAHLYRNDTVFFATAQQLLVIGIDGVRVTLVRTDKYRARYFGGVAYRKWHRTENNDYDHNGDLYGPWVPPPRRATPLVSRRRHWPDMVIPAGTPLVVMGSSYAEGTDV